MNIKHNFFKNTFFSWTMIEWNKLDPAIRNSASFNSLNESILKFIRPAPNSIFQCIFQNFRHLQDHKFKQSFQDTINPLWNCRLEAETTNHFTLHCPFYVNEGHILLASIRSIKIRSIRIPSILDQNDNDIVKKLLFGLGSLSETQNTSILNATMIFLIPFNRFEEQLY